MKRMHASLMLSVALALPWSWAQCAAVDYPSRPIRIIVPFPPGGSNDLLARYFGDKLTERLGQQTVIDNRAGANGIIGTQLAAGTTPDGYTALAISVSYTMNAAVRTLPYDVVKAFDPIANEVCFKLRPDLDIVYAESAEDLVEGCDAVVLVTEWDDFKRLDPKRVSELMAGDLFIDARNVVDPEALRRAGLRGEGIGRT